MAICVPYAVYALGQHKNHGLVLIRCNREQGHTTTFVENFTKDVGTAYNFSKKRHQ